ncbi:hypothetical protein CRE_09220 [Caenorhabditis remanei]|uniref:Serpentine Receptor, class H n=1 Tax=Caenorhabditis remanei TaxID=31234 RepID=E3LHK8_CAERE|nr:hypothetical protein CRE_09220 [Caenorhabditis remanei]
MNMSYCTESNYLDTSEFQSSFLHFFGFIAIPVHILGAYCILFKTPPAMNSVKWVLLNFHLWSCFLDFALSWLTTPYVIFPALAGYPLGVLKTLGIGVGEQIFFIMATVGVLLVAMVLIFETRLLVLFGFQHWWRRIRIPWFILDHIVAIVYFIPLYNRIPDQSILKDIIILRVKCVPVYVDLDSMYLFSNVKVVPTTVVSLIMAFYMFQVLIFTFLTAWFLNKQMKRSISENTIKMQKKFLIALVLQMVIPALILVMPAGYLVFSAWCNFHFQYFNNICLIIISSHGFSTTIAMLLIHTPYRKFLLGGSRFRTRFRSEKNNSVRDMMTTGVTRI